VAAVDPGLTARRIVAIVGPTASGKSALALEVAKRFRGEIVSCDSVQVYRGLDIGSGKPSAEEQARVRHHLLDILDIDAPMNAAVFVERASAAIDDILRRGGLPIVTGGTGLYLTALLKGLFAEDFADPSLRSRLERLGGRHGSVRLHRLLAARDPEYARRTKPADRVRIVRALEVCFASGRPFSRVQVERQPAYTGEVLIVGLHPDREDLRRRVTARVERMLAEGLIEETRRALSLVAEGAPMPRPLGAIGYREVVARLASSPLDPGGDRELQRAIVTSTMQYAKRQMTYFRRQFDVEWFADGEAAIARLAGFLGHGQTGAIG
jgi:tRNA dimethylallyltransferase